MAFSKNVFFLFIFIILVFSFFYQQIKISEDSKKIDVTEINFAKNKTVIVDLPKGVYIIVVNKSNSLSLNTNISDTDFFLRKNSFF